MRDGHRPLTTFSILGHDFIQNRCACGRSWLDLRSTPREWIGQTGVHHDLHTTLTEWAWEQIDKRRKEEDEQMERALGWRK